MKFKKYTAIGMAVLMMAGVPNGVFAAALIGGATTTKYVEKQEEKKLLTLEEAIKKAVGNNLALKKYEVTRESLLKQIDSSYRNDKSIFDAREIQESQLPSVGKPGTPAYEQAKQQMDYQFQKAMANSDVVKASLISQRGSIDMNTVMERESVGININRLFTSIQQKQKDIDILEQKIEQDKKNINIYEKQLNLGKISQSKFDELALETTKNANRMTIEKSKLSGYYRELENATLLSNIEKNYNLEVKVYDYAPFELTPETQKAKEQSAADLSALVSSKTAAVKISTSKYDNYPYVMGDENTTYTQVLDNKYLSELEESEAIRTSKANAQKKYNNIQELQQNIELTKKDITKLENQLNSLKNKYSLGLISKNTLDNSIFALKEAQNGLESLKTQHYQLRQMYENSYFAGL